MKILLSSLLALSLASVAMADEKAGDAAPAKASKKERKAHAAGAHRRGYGIAGCGLGSVAVGSKPGGIQILAGFLNDIGSNQTFGITSGTSNCDLPTMGPQAAMFIEVNKEVVMKDAARGEGETIDSISAILGCTDSQFLGSKIQKGYEQIFNHNKDSFETTRRIINTIKSDSELKQTCPNIG